jgi:Ras-related protein Rab-2A
VSTEEGAEFAQQEGLLFVEASAKSGLNVELAFVEASKDILQKVKNGVFNDTRVSPSFHQNTWMLM